MFDFIVKILLIFLRKIFLNNKKIISILILIICVKFFLIVDKHKITHNEKIKDLAYFNLVYNDYNVSTTNYLVDYNLYRNKIYDLNLLLNKKNLEFKSIELNTRSLASLNKNEYLIVEYTPVFGEQKFCNTDSTNLIVNECPFKNCKFTCDKSYQYKADALLFSEFDLYQLTIEDRVFLKKTLSNHENRQKQVWILWNDEAFPVSSAWDAYYFNWTMSYRTDSEISDCSYGCAYSKKASFSLDNLQKNFIEKIHQISSAQKNQAVWFVSNCNAGYRIRFALNLEKYYNLKIYGNCEQQADYLRTNNLKNENYFFKYFISIFKSTKKFFSFNSKNKCDRFSECELNAFKSNKYYLSFESKNCTSYITEKLWKILRTYMIPIVIQPSKKFYELVAPKNSFIHAQDFNYDAEKLANYLNLLDTNFDLYLKYHLWRLEYDIIYTSRKSESRRLCELCSRLNQETSSIFYKKISSWFASDCVIN